MNKKAIVAGAALASTAVILGAMNAHYLKQFFSPDTTASFDTGVRYQMYHALAILGVINFSDFIGSKNIMKIIGLFVLGTILFSGSIYFLCAFKANGIIGLKGLGALTPIGGLILIIAWLLLIIYTIKAKKKTHSN